MFSVGLEILTVVTMKNPVFWVVTACGPMQVNNLEELAISLLKIEE
jgi:hypothetical protein